MLKKKALTAVLTAAFVLGIGDMVTGPVSTHEHSQGDTCIRSIFEPAAVHAASVSISNTASAHNSSWRCYWCGKVNRGSQYIQDNKGVWRSREPNTRDERCPHKHEQAGGRHGWVWVSGAPPVDNYSTYYYCRRCNEMSGRYQKGDWPTHHKGCRLNNGGSHDWAPTGIIRTR